MTKKQTNRRGKYQEWVTEEGLLKIEGWARDGLIDEQIAHNMGIAERTLTRWKDQHPSVMSALKRGKEVVDRQVENALLKSALGYEYDEVTIERIIDGGQKKRHGGMSELTETEWMLAKAYFNHSCAYCGSGGKLTKDHYIPLNKGGFLSAENVLPACGSCNSSKKDHDFAEWFEGRESYKESVLTKIKDYFTFIQNKQNIDNPSGEMVTTKIVKKQVAPNTGSIAFWLKNRKPAEWRDKQDIEHSGEIKNNVDLSGLSVEELRKLANSDN